MSVATVGVAVVVLMMVMGWLSVADCWCWLASGLTSCVPVADHVVDIAEVIADAVSWLRCRTALGRLVGVGGLWCFLLLYMCVGSLMGIELLMIGS